jgi:FtsH-binding integral membrane protein
VVRRHGSEAAMAAVARRFGIGSGVALVVLLATGIAMAGHYSLWEDSTLQIKLMLVVLLAVLLGMHVVSPKARALSIAVLLSTLVIVWLGVELAHGL